MDSFTKERLYRYVAQRMRDDFTSGQYRSGDRLPSERELSARYEVSRPTIREAVIALEVQGVLEVRLGSGAYFCAIPEADAPPVFDVSAFELTEARLLVEGEAAALAAHHINDAEIAELGALVDDMESENQRNAGTEVADREFHMTIARATRNMAMAMLIENLWDVREKSKPTALLYTKARAADVKPVVAEHRAIVTALRNRDAAQARAAMRAHLSAVLDSLLFAMEEQHIKQAQEDAADRRKRLAKTMLG